jgi:hypothetical protein
VRNLTDWTTTGSVVQKQKARIQAADYLRVRGTKQLPEAPRGLYIQPGPRGFLVSWSLPVNFDDIVGWRLYKDDEGSLYQDIRDRGIRQKFIDATAGATPPTVNVFVSSVNAMGYESPKIQGQGSALAEAGAPPMPAAPPASIGNNQSSSYQPTKPSADRDTNREFGRGRLSTF